MCIPRSTQVRDGRTRAARIVHRNRTLFVEEIGPEPLHRGDLADGELVCVRMRCCAAGMCVRVFVEVCAVGRGEVVFVFVPMT